MDKDGTVRIFPDTEYALDTIRARYNGQTPHDADSLGRMLIDILWLSGEVDRLLAERLTCLSIIAKRQDRIDTITTQRDHARAWAVQWRWNALGGITDEAWPEDPEQLASDGWSGLEAK